MIFLCFSLYISLYSLMHFLSLYSNAKAEISNFCNSSRRQLVCNLFPTITRARISYSGSRPVRAGRGHQLPVLGPKTSCPERNLKLWRVCVCLCVCLEYCSMIGAIVPLSTGRLRSRIELQARAIAHQAALLTVSGTRLVWYAALLCYLDICICWQGV